MSHSHTVDQRSQTRRSFLQTLATAIGLAATAPSLAVSQDSPELTRRSTAGRLKVGVVLPRFGSSGSYVSPWLDGLQLALEDSTDIELAIEQGGNRYSQVLAGVLRLLDRGEPDIIVGAITPYNTPALARALTGRATVFLNVEPGAHVAHAAASRPNVFHHSLHLWQANYATGIEAARTFGAQGAMITSFREAGYDTASAFGMGFSAAGGRLLDTRISHVPGQQCACSELIAEILSSGPDFVYVNASGVEARELLALLPRSALSSPMARFAGAGDSAFATGYERCYGRKPDAYGLLGFEAGQLITAAAHASAQSDVPLAQALQSAEFESPRGRISMDATTQSTRTQAFVDHSSAVIAGLESVEERVLLAHPDWQHAVSGWSVPYSS